MKTTFAIAALLASGAAMATATPVSGFRSQSLQSPVSTVTTPAFETAGRKGSKRVGGSGKSGKGGRYVGGRK